MCRKLGVRGGAEHTGAAVDRSTKNSTKRKVSDPDFVQKFLDRSQIWIWAELHHQIWCELMAKPRHLAFGVLPRVIDGDPARLVERQISSEVAKELWCTVCLQARPARIGPPVEHRAR